MFVATLQVYFRDLRNFLPYFMRLWLYTSPVLYYVDDMPERLQADRGAEPALSAAGALSESSTGGESECPRSSSGGSVAP